MTPCITGCTQRGQHTTTCPDRCEHLAPARPGTPRPCPKGCTGDCKGCTPRPAEFGRLCAWCWQRLNGDIVDSPSLARYLWAVGHTDEKPTGDGRGGSDPSERSILSGALDALDGLHAMLASWARVILEEHPDGPRMTGPDQRGARTTTGTKRLDPTTFPHHDDEPTVWVRPAEVAGVHDPEATSRLVRWLLPQLAWCSRQEWAGEMRREIASVVRTTAARYPVTERTRAIPGVECPVCSRMSLVFDPPTPERHTTQVNCSTHGCGVIYTEEEFKLLTRRVLYEHDETERAAG